MVEREKQVKARLDDALKTVSRYEDEIENWKQKHAADVGAAEKAYNDAVSTHAGEAQQLKSSHETVVVAMQAEHGERMQQIVRCARRGQGADHRQVRGGARILEAENARAMEKLRESAQNERDGLRLRFEEQSADQAQRHDATVQQLNQEHDGVVAALKSEHGEAVSEKDQLHADEIAGLRARYTRDGKETERRHQEEIAGLHGTHKRELQAADERRRRSWRRRPRSSAGARGARADHMDERQQLEQDHMAALHALDERRQSELREAAEVHAGSSSARARSSSRSSPTNQELRDTHMRKMQALEESHADLKAGMQQRHAQQLDEIKKEHESTIGEYDAALAQRDTLITDGHARIAELEGADHGRRAESKRVDTRATSSRRG